MLEKSYYSKMRAILPETVSLIFDENGTEDLQSELLCIVGNLIDAEIQEGKLEDIDAINACIAEYDVFGEIVEQENEKIIQEMENQIGQNDWGAVYNFYLFLKGRACSQEEIAKYESLYIDAINARSEEELKELRAAVENNNAGLIKLLSRRTYSNTIPITKEAEREFKKYREDIETQEKQRVEIKKENNSWNRDIKTIDTGGKQIWQVYAKSSELHFTGSFRGSGYFGIKILDSNQDFFALVANEIGDYNVDKSVYGLTPDEMYYIQIECTDGSWTCSWTGTYGR